MSTKSIFRLVTLFIAAGILGSLGDVMHVESGTLGYAATHLPVFPRTGQPIWVPFLFGFAGLAIGGAHAWIRAKQPVPGRNQALVGTLLLLGLWGASGFLPLATGGAKDLFMAACALLIWFFWDRTLQGVLLGVITAIAGTAFEINLTHTGAFYYLPHASNLFGVPTWLPWLYLAASVTVGAMGRNWLLSQSQLTAAARSESRPYT